MCTRSHGKIVIHPIRARTQPRTGNQVSERQNPLRTGPHRHTHIRLRNPRHGAPIQGEPTTIPQLIHGSTRQLGAERVRRVITRQSLSSTDACSVDRSTRIDRDRIVDKSIARGTDVVAAGTQVIQNLDVAKAFVKGIGHEITSFMLIDVSEPERWKAFPESNYCRPVSSDKVLSVLPIRWSYHSEPQSVSARTNLLRPH